MLHTGIIAAALQPQTLGEAREQIAAFGRMERDPFSAADAEMERAQAWGFGDEYGNPTLLSELAVREPRAAFTIAEGELVAKEAAHHHVRRALYLADALRDPELLDTREERSRAESEQADEIEKATEIADEAGMSLERLSNLVITDLKVEELATQRRELRRQRQARSPRRQFARRAA